MNEIENIIFKKPLFELNAPCINEILKLQGKNILLPFNMNNCFGSVSSLICGTGTLKIFNFLLSNTFIVYCFEDDKNSFNYFKTLKDNGFNIDIKTGPNVVIHKETIQLEPEYSKNGRKLKPKFIEKNVLNYKLEAILHTKFDVVISKEGIMPKIDYIIGNPPYGESGMGSQNLHFEIAESLLGKYNEKMLLIMPNRIGYSTSEKFNSWKEKFNMISNIIDVGNPFTGVSVQAGLFVFENHKVNSVEVFGSKYSSLTDLSSFTVYENKFMEKLKSNFSKTSFMMTTTNYIDKLKSYAFACTYNNGAKFGCGIYFSSITEDLPVMTKNKFIKWNESYKNGQKCCITNNSLIYLQNLKNAMKRPLLRFGLFKMQDDRHLTGRCYNYIPDIDWENNKTKTDEGILEMCGIDSEDAKVFSKYCEDFIKNLDIKNGIITENEKRNVIKNKKMPTNEDTKKLQSKSLKLIKTMNNRTKKAFDRAYSVEWNKIYKKYPDNKELRSYNWAKVRLTIAKKFIK